MILVEFLLLSAVLICRQCIFVFSNTVKPPVSKHPKCGNCFFSSLQDVAYMGKLSLYSLHFLDPSQSEVTKRACMLRLIQESQNRLKFEIENNAKKKLYQINAFEPWLTYYIMGPLKIKIVFHIIFTCKVASFFTFNLMLKFSVY